MNSPPMCCSGHRLAASTTAATASVSFGAFSTPFSKGRYTAIRKRLSGFVVSSGMRPRIR